MSRLFPANRFIASHRGSVRRTAEGAFSVHGVLQCKRSASGGPLGSLGSRRNRVTTSTVVRLAPAIWRGALVSVRSVPPHVPAEGLDLGGRRCARPAERSGSTRRRLEAAVSHPPRPGRSHKSGGERTPLLAERQGRVQDFPKETSEGNNRDSDSLEGDQGRRHHPDLTRWR